MTTLSTELYDALIAAGAPEDKARAAAADHLPVAMLATKADLRAGLAELKADLTWRMIIALGIFTSIILLLQKFG